MAFYAVHDVARRACDGAACFTSCAVHDVVRHAWHCAVCMTLCAVDDVVRRCGLKVWFLPGNKANHDLVRTLFTLFFVRSASAQRPDRFSSSLSQRPTHRGSIFRLLLKIAVGLPRSCDSSQFLQGFGPNQLKKGLR